MADLLQNLDIGADDTRLYKLRDAATESIAETQQTSASDWAIPCLDGVVREKSQKKISMPSAPSMSESSIVAKGTCFSFAAARGGLASNVLLPWMVK